MKKSLIATALLSAVVFAPSSASANYYGYQRCLNNGGGYFGCLGELADGMVAGPALEQDFGFVRNYGKDRVMESVKELSKTCDALKGKEQSACYSQGLEKSLKLEAKPAVGAVRKDVVAPATSLKASPRLEALPAK